MRRDEALGKAMIYHEKVAKRVPGGLNALNGFVAVLACMRTWVVEVVMAGC